VWLQDGESRALQLVQDAQRRLGDVDLRCVSLDASAPAAMRPRVALSGLGSIAQGEDAVIIDRAYEGVGRVFTYVPVRVDAPAPVAIEVSRSRPLADLVTQARRVGEGDLSYRIATRRRDEITGVAHEMNRMCDRLREARESERLHARRLTVGTGRKAGLSCSALRHDCARATPTRRRSRHGAADSAQPTTKRE